MRLRRITIKNFRNFRNLTVQLHDHAVIVGPNGTGKSNFLHAIRLVLDPSLPDSLRQLREEDFWDGVPRPISADARIEIVVELSDFVDDDAQLANLAEHLVETDPLVARLTYVFRATPGVADPSPADGFEFFVFGGSREDNRIGYEIRRRLPIDVFHALRDAEGDMTTWRRSPLRPLLERAWAQVEATEKDKLAKELKSASDLITTTTPLQALSARISEALTKRADGSEATSVGLGVAETDADALVRVVRLLLDDGRRGIGDISLGLANVVFFTLKLLELAHLVETHARDHTFVAIEEPEAHLHPQLQRQMFRSFLRVKPHFSDANKQSLEELPTTILVTTHSPHLASIAPLKSLVVFRRTQVDIGEEGRDDMPSTRRRTTATIAASMVELELEAAVERDLERYIEVSRAELLFARGVILVEGDAERYLVPRIASLEGFDLDARGISVCPVGGTHFNSYVLLLLHVGIPFVVVTDGDPNLSRSGKVRIADLLRLMPGDAESREIPDIEVLRVACQHGLFVGETTFEVDLLRSGRGKSITKVLGELAQSDAARNRAKDWYANPKTIDEAQLVKDIAEIGKGRFAQRLSAILGTCRGAQGPQYVVNAIRHIADAVSQ